MLAQAFLSITAAAEHAQPPPAGQIPLTRNEIAVLFSTLIIKPVTGTPHRLRWSACPPKVLFSDQDPASRQNLPLPATSPPIMKVTKSGWSNKPP